MYKLINNNLFQIDIKLEIGFKMGNQICFNKKENFISALDERELSEAIRLQKIIIYKKIKEINKISKLELSQGSFKNEEDYSKRSGRLKNLVIELQTNFYLITLHGILNDLEERFFKQKYKNFNDVLKEFITFFNKVSFEFNYECLIDESKKFNDYLDDFS